MKNSIIPKIAKGTILFTIAYITHSDNPIININVQRIDMSFVDFVFNVLINCGDKANATKKPAR